MNKVHFASGSTDEQVTASGAEYLGMAARGPGALASPTEVTVVNGGTTATDVVGMAEVAADETKNFTLSGATGVFCPAGISIQRSGDAEVIVYYR